MVAEIQNSEKIKENNKMNYTVLNEELRIYACHVGDLTGKEAGKFLEKFPDSPLSSMTIYYKPEEDIILVNADFKGKKEILELALFCLTEEIQKIDDFLYKVSHGGILEAAQVLLEIRFIRAARKGARTGHEICKKIDTGLNVDEIREIKRMSDDEFSLVTNSFYLGVARGYEAKKRTT